MRSRIRLTLGLFGLLLLVASPADAVAQQVDSAIVGIRRPVPVRQLPAVQRDSTRPPIGPGRAFLYSLMLPGLGQSRLQRSSAGAFYFLIEGMSIAMAAKSLYDLRIAKEHRHDRIVTAYQPGAFDSLGVPIAADSLRNRYAGSRVKARRTHVEDWAAALVFNHLFAGADAFVAAQLWDLPIQVGFRVAPSLAALRAISRY